MIGRALASIARLVVAYPRLVLAAGLVPALLSLLAFRVPLDLSFSGVMDRANPEVARYFAASERYGLGGLLPLLLEGSEEQLGPAVSALVPALEARAEVRSVVAGPPWAWLRAHAPYLIDREVFDDWLQLATAAPSREPAARARLERALADVEAGPFAASSEGARLVLVTLEHDAFELALDASDFPRVRAETEHVLARFGVTASFAGMAAIVTQEQEATIARMRWLGPASLALAVLILASVERRPLVLASAGLPMLLAVGCTLGAIGALTGELTLMESVFGVLVFGLGIDFAIHLLLRIREEQRAGAGLAESTRRAITGTGRGIAASAATTGGAFLILALSPDPVFRRLGLAGGLGLLLCFVLLVCLLPAALLWLEARAPRHVHAARAGGNVLALLAGLCAARPWLTLGVGAVALAASIQVAPSLRYETNIERVFSRDIEAVRTSRRIHEHFGVDPGPWLVAAQDLEEARDLELAFGADPVFARTQGLGSLLPPDMDARAAALRARSAVLEESLRAARESGQVAAGDSVERLLAAAQLGPPQLDALPAELADRFVGPDGELLVYAFVAEPAIDSRLAAREREVARAIAPGATSMSAIYAALLGTERPWLRPILAGLCAFLVVVLLLDLRSARLAGLALVPVTSATAATVALLSLAGFSFNTLTLVAIPLLLGLGVDDGIHLVHRLLEQPEESLERSVGTVGRSIAMTTITSCGSVSLLLLTGHPGIESVAIVLLVGLPLCLLASVTLLPAAAVALRAPALAARRAARGTGGAG